MIIISTLVTLILGVVAVYAIGAAIVLALVALINAYYAVKSRITHSHFYKVARILIKRYNNKIEQIVVVIGPDGSVMESQQSESFSAEQMKGTPIEKAFEEAERKPDSRVDGDTAIKWEPTEQEEEELRNRAN